MAIFTNMSIEAARHLGGPLGLGVSGVVGIRAGSVNSNFQLALAGGGRAFARVYEEQDAEGAARECDLLDRLADAGVATPRPIRGRDGRAVQEHAGKPVAVFPWVEGEVLCQRRVDAAASRKVGAALATVHRAGRAMDAEPGRFALEALAGRLAGIGQRPDVPAALTETVPGLERRVSRHLATPIRHDGLIHGDLFRDNVLWKDGEIVALLDFESASLGSYPYDLMVTVLAWCVGDTLEPDLARAMVEGYQSVRPLSADEISRLYDDACFAALRFTITRITDFELRPRGQGVYKDYRRFLMRLEALEAMGPQGLLTTLGLSHSGGAP